VIAGGRGAWSQLCYFTSEKYLIECRVLPLSQSKEDLCQRRDFSIPARIYRPSFHENKPKTLVFRQSYKMSVLGLFSPKTGSIISARSCQCVADCSYLFISLTAT
jgi:hypothetical protein